MASLSNSTSSSCVSMLTTPPDGHNDTLPDLSSSPSPPLSNSPPQVRRSAIKDGASMPSLEHSATHACDIDIPQVNSQSAHAMPASLSNAGLSSIHGVRHHATFGCKEGGRRRSPPSPLKGLESSFNQLTFSTNTTMGTPASLTSAAVPLTPRGCGGGSQWLTSTSSPQKASSLFPIAQPDHQVQTAEGCDDRGQYPIVNEEVVGLHLLITGIPNFVTKDEMHLLIEDLAPYRAILVRHLETHGSVIICFHDARDALKVYQALQTGSVRFTHAADPVFLYCRPVSRDLVRAVEGDAENFYQKVWRDSTTCIEVSVRGPVSAVAVRTILSRMGDLRRFRVHSTGTAFSAQYFDSRAAAKAVLTLSGAQIGDCTFTVKPSGLDEDPFDSSPLLPSTAGKASRMSEYTLASAARGESRSHQAVSETQHAQRVELLGTSDGTSRASSSSRQAATFGTQLESFRSQPPSPSVRSTWTRSHAYSTGTTDRPNGPIFSQDDRYPQTQPSRWADPSVLQNILDQMSLTARAFQQTSSLHGVPPHNPQAIPVENVIHMDRIMSGLDKRTTVMIKDVPNKLSRQELVNILRDVVPGGFDFVYLRFDFNNHCNVGYAFVNFTSIQALLTFVDRKAGRKWNMFASEKVLQVSYANIQGKSNLIQKFKNSHVMDAPEEWRPQIFYSEGALKGQPEPFPEADHHIRHHPRMSLPRPTSMPAPVESNGGGVHGGFKGYRQPV